MYDIDLQFHVSNDVVVEFQAGRLKCIERCCYCCSAAYFVRDG